MQIWFHSAEIFWPSYELKQIPLQSDPRRSSCCEEKHAIHPTASQFKQQRRKNQNNSTRSCFFLLSSFTDKAAGLLLWSWLPRRHYMQDSDIVQRIQPQLLHMAWTASVKQRLLYLVCTCCTTTLSLCLSRCFTAEFLFLLWAVYLCYAVRTVPSAFHEPRYMAIAVHNELVLSAIFYVIR